MATVSLYPYQWHSSNMTLSSGRLVTSNNKSQCRELRFVFQQSGAPFPIRRLIVLVTRRPELSAIFELCHSCEDRRFTQSLSSIQRLFTAVQAWTTPHLLQIKSVEVNWVKHRTSHEPNWFNCMGSVHLKYGIWSGPLNRGPILQLILDFIIYFWHNFEILLHLAKFAHIPRINGTLE